MRAGVLLFCVAASGCVIGCHGGNSDGNWVGRGLAAIPNPVPSPTPSIVSSPSPSPPSPLSLIEARSAADVQIYAWDTQERIRLGSPTSDNGSLMLLSIDAFSPLIPWRADSRPYQYGRKTLLFDIRRAARYVQILRPELAPLRAADLSQADGSTPSDLGGLRHPSGAHINGYSADLSYLANLGMGSAPPSSEAELDIEGTVWVIYSLLQSPAVESILTAYKDLFVKKMEQWNSAGVVGTEALTRFRNDLWQDSTLNHNGHMHVNTSDRPGLLLDPVNDFYRCYQAISGSWGTLWSPVSC